MREGGRGDEVSAIKPEGSPAGEEAVASFAVGVASVFAMGVCTGRSGE